MEYKLLDLTLAQLGRLFFLIKRFEAVEIGHGRDRWAILIHGRGFTRLLEEDVLPMRGALYPAASFGARPKAFPNRQTAENWMRHMGMLPRQARWTLAGR